MKISKKIIVLILSMSMILGGMPGNFTENQKKIEAATFEDINQGSVFLKQAKGSVTCTLVSAAMLLRRAAMMSGNSNWSAITESSLESTAWVNGQGLKHNFSYAGLDVSYGNDLGGNSDKLISLLNDHPEGIVIYNTSIPHAILVTDYSNGIFYCADPSPYYPSGRIEISRASFNVNSATRYWYVSSPKLSFDVKTVTKATLGFDRTVFLCAGAITFYGNADGGNFGQVDIYKEGSYYKSLNLPPNSYVTDYFDYPGSYHAVYWVTDGNNTVTAEVQNFTVHNTYVCVPQNMDVGLEKNVFKQNESVTVYMFSDYVTSYDLKIYKNGSEIVSDNIKAFHECIPGYTYKIYKFAEPGEYIIKSQARNMHGVSEQKECRFIVQDDNASLITQSPAPTPTVSDTPSKTPILTSEPITSVIPSARPTVSPAQKTNTTVKGDVNGDNVITLLDAKIVLKAALGISSLPDETIGDLDGDNIITLSDAKILLKAALGILDLTDETVKK